MNDNNEITGLLMNQVQTREEENKIYEIKEENIQTI